MFDTLSIARQLAAAGIEPEQADAIAEAVKTAAEHDASGIDTKTLATKADLAELRAELAAGETRLTRRLVGAMAPSAPSSDSSADPVQGTGREAPWLPGP